MFALSPTTLRHPPHTHLVQSTTGSCLVAIWSSRVWGNGKRLVSHPFPFPFCDIFTLSVAPHSMQAYRRGKKKGRVLGNICVPVKGELARKKAGDLLL